MAITKDVYLYAVFILFGAFLLSPYGHYLIGKIYFWHLIAVSISPIFVLAFLKYARHSAYIFIFLIYLCLASVVSFARYGVSVDTILKNAQFIVVISFFVGFIFYSRQEEFRAKFADYFWKLEIIIVSFAFIQFFLRAFLPGLSFSDFQNFRVLFGPIKQTSSFFYEPRGLSQFLNCALFINLFLCRKVNTKRVIREVVALCLTFSLGGFLTMIVIFTVYMLRSLKNPRNSIFIVAGFGIFATLLSVNVFDPVTNRITGLLENTRGISFQVILENAYKLNHRDFYSQYSKEFEEVYGFSGGSSTISSLSEISWIYKALSERPILAYALINDERYVSLNGLADMLIRFGLLGFSIFALALRKHLRFTMPVLIFLIFFLSIDGALSKPQIWFLLGAVIIFQKRLDSGEEGLFVDQSDMNLSQKKLTGRQSNI